MFRLVLLVTLLAGSGQIDPAATKAESDPADQNLKRWLEIYTEEADGYSFFLGEDKRTELKRHPEILLHYTNDVRGGRQHGAIYIWTHQGRPEVVGSIWSSVPSPGSSVRGITNEFVSISEKPVVSEHERRVGRAGIVPNWAPSEPGVVLQEIAGAPEPASSAPLRLVQMRRLARTFTANISQSRLEGEAQLRLQPQPLYRYSSPAADVLDGALFSYVMATDPELLLILEARETADGPRWHYAAARFTNRPLQLKRDDRSVWSCGQAEPYVGNHTYFLYWGVATRPRIEDE